MELENWYVYDTWCAFLQNTGKENHLDFECLGFNFLSVDIKQHSYYIVTSLFSANFAAQQGDKICRTEH